ncbi:hypothetical protein DMUE_1378 [Dictyocoela muelleri]|nr:hypothetical protein DMUE_1378 [Dictyocoela muelleri]
MRKLHKIKDLNDDISKIIKKAEGEDFYMFDTGIDDKDRVIVLSTFSNIIHLSYNKTWICDRTFRSSPSGLYQIYTIMAIINYRSFPLAYLIMKNKSQNSYSKALNF